MKFNFLHLLKIITVEIAYFYLVKFSYPVFSMLMFGAGANSFMYSNANGVIFVGLMIVPQTIFNIYKAKKYRENYRPKSVNYLLVEFLMIILTLNFVVNEF
jgi:hypothetical protein